MDLGLQGNVPLLQGVVVGLVGSVHSHLPERVFAFVLPHAHKIRLTKSSQNLTRPGIKDTLLLSI